MQTADYHRTYKYGDLFRLPPIPSTPSLTSMDLTINRRSMRLADAIKRYFPNYEQRNVHIWASKPSNPKNICIVGGCYTFNILRFKELHEWSYMMIDPQQSADKRSYALCRINFNPMQKTPEEYSDEVTKIETAGEYGDLQLDEVIHIPEGEVCHFVLFKVSVGGKKLERFTPRLHEAQIRGRIPPKETKETWKAQAESEATPKGEDGNSQNVASGSGKKSGDVAGSKSKGDEGEEATIKEAYAATRSKTVVDEVRERDGQCRVTGLPLHQRLRGPNTIGLEVAHIFPLAYIREAGSIGNKEIERFINSPKNADQVDNAMLLRSDIHAYFDDHQFSFMPVDGTSGKHKVVRFEKTGAPGLQQYFEPGANGRELQPEIGPGRGAIPAVNALFLKNHLFHCLLDHVAGLGRPKPA